ncbi:hypothetical protein BDV93DRAFT_565563 [Ceratobasidium sp. AG-I]|nr:hypothetical protein BDV93DRAFT_565563 [Ceratobasidium sp. AG-I]
MPRLQRPRPSPACDRGFPVCGACIEHGTANKYYEFYRAPRVHTPSSSALSPPPDLNPDEEEGEEQQPPPPPPPPPQSKRTDRGSDANKRKCNSSLSKAESDQGNALGRHSQHRPATIQKHRRPAIIPGRVAEANAYIIPLTLVKIFAEGWNSYVPLTHLTDDYCAKHKPTAKSGDVLTLDSGTGQLYTSMASLPETHLREEDLSESQFVQAWKRLAYLLGKYCSHISGAWDVNWMRMFTKADFSKNFKLYLCYDIRVRQMSLIEPLDPSTFQTPSGTRCEWTTKWTS